MDLLILILILLIDGPNIELGSPVRAQKLKPARGDNQLHASPSPAAFVWVPLPGALGQLGTALDVVLVVARSQ